MQHLPPASVLKNKSNQRMLNDHQPSVTAANTPSREKADTWSLVLWAMNIFHEVTRDDAGFHFISMSTLTTLRPFAVNWLTMKRKTATGPSRKGRLSTEPFHRRSHRQYY
jgi:hypothetical protein